MAKGGGRTLILYFGYAVISIWVFDDCILFCILAACILQCDCKRVCKYHCITVCSPYCIIGGGGAHLPTGLAVGTGKMVWAGFLPEIKLAWNGLT